jgi:hypothetical protein
VNAKTRQHGAIPDVGGGTPGVLRKIQRVQARRLPLMGKPVRTLRLYDNFQTLTGSFSCNALGNSVVTYVQ